MSASTFSQSFGRDRRDCRATAPRAGTTRAAPRRRASGEWVGTVGEQIRVVVEVENITSEARGLQRYLVRSIETGDLLEWCSTRRYGIHVGERLSLSGLVKAHLHRDGDPVTTLRDCFNPLRMT